MKWRRSKMLSNFRLQFCSKKLIFQQTEMLLELKEFANRVNRCLSTQDEQRVPLNALGAKKKTLNSQIHFQFSPRSFANKCFNFSKKSNGFWSKHVGIERNFLLPRKPNSKSKNRNEFQQLRVEELRTMNLRINFSSWHSTKLKVEDFKRQARRQVTTSKPVD